jgi:HK97 family phage prohead protease/HK97 family phage major capsid protein
MPNPSDFDNRDDFVSACISARQRENPGEDVDQSVAACNSIWDEHVKSAKGRRKDVTPEPDEDYEDFMDRCTNDEGEEADDCEIYWSERSVKGRQVDKVVHKTHAEDVQGMEFVLSDETPDRMDDIIMSDGWQLNNFKKNPIALFGHRSDFPIGKWVNVRVENKQLRGHLQMAPEGTSERIDEIRRLIDAGILKAVSVGFRPQEHEALDKENPFSGFKFTKQELVETSLVSVPANPNALSVAKSLRISPETQQLVFAKQGARDEVQRRGFTGKQAVMSRRRGVVTMSLSKRIEDAETRLTAKKDALAAMLEKVDDSNVSDEQLEQVTAANADIAQEERGLAVLRESEKHLSATAEQPGRSLIAAPAVIPAKKNGGTAPAARPFNMSVKKLDPIDLLVRAGTVQLFSHIHKKPIDEIRRAIYGEDESTKVIVDWAQRAASAPALSTVTGWAAELVQQIVVSFMETLLPKSVFPRLSNAGLSLSFGRNGKIIIPTRARTPTIAGSFVGEGLPIPVRQGLFTSQTLVPKKMAVITTWTREIAEHSIPAIEGLLRNAIGEDTAISLDAVLLDAGAATAVRPAGILNGVSGLTPTAGGGFNAAVGDIKALTGALLTGTAGNIRNPVYLMNPQQLASLGLIAMPGAGVFPFRAEVAAGNLGGWSIIDSGTVPMGTVIAMDAADFVSVSGDAPRFELSDQATLHMEDTAPTDITTTGAPAVAAFPVKSMWQTDSIALRLIMPVNWTIRRPGVVAWVAGVTW